MCVCLLCWKDKQSAVLWHKLYSWLHYMISCFCVSLPLFRSHRWTLWMWIAQKTSSLHQDWLSWATWAATNAVALDPSPNTSVPFAGTDLQVQLTDMFRCCIWIWLVSSGVHDKCGCVLQGSTMVFTVVKVAKASLRGPSEKTWPTRVETAKSAWSTNVSATAANTAAIRSA